MADTKKKKRRKANVGLTLPDGRRVEAGKPLPEGFDPPDWLVEQGKVT